MRQAPLFSALDDSQLQQLLRACVTRSLPAGAHIFGPAQKADRFYLILAGKVKVYKQSAGGDEQILHLYTAGQTFGEAAMLADIRYPAHAQTLDDSTLLIISRRALKGLIDSSADLAFALMAGLSAKLREFNLLIEQLSLKEVPARLAGVLLELSRQAGDDTFRLKQTKRELAAQIGTVAETLSRALKKLKSMGLIEVKGSTITVVDAEAMADLARS